MKGSRGLGKSRKKENNHILLAQRSLSLDSTKYCFFGRKVSTVVGIMIMAKPSKICDVDRASVSVFIDFSATSKTSLANFGSNSWSFVNSEAMISFKKGSSSFDSFDSKRKTNGEVYFVDQRTPSRDSFFSFEELTDGNVGGFDDVFLDAIGSKVG